MGFLSAADLACLAYIDNHPIVVSFGPPTVLIPEPGTILLLCSGLLGVGSPKEIQIIVLYL